MSQHPGVRSIVIRGLRGNVLLTTDPNADGVTIEVESTQLYGYWDREPGAVFIHPRPIGRPVGLLPDNDVDTLSLVDGVVAYWKDPDYLHGMQQPKVRPEAAQILTTEIFEATITITAEPGVTIHLLNCIGSVFKKIHEMGGTSNIDT